jgi:flagellin-like protein
MVTVTVLTVYALGAILAPGPTRAVFKVLSPVVGTLIVVLFIFWRILPSSTCTLRRF